MKIKAIKANNFKSFSFLEVDSFLDMNFIFGFNNSGKSNLLKLIDIIFSRKTNQRTTKYDTPEGSTATRTVTEVTNFWEGIIENHNYIFRFGDHSKDITFSVIIELKTKEISGLKVYPELQKIIEKSKPKKGKVSELGNKAIELKEERVQAKVHAKIRSGALNPKVVEEESMGCIIEITGKIIALGEYNARQELVSVKINQVKIYDNNESPSGSFDVFELLTLMNDSVLFIDYDRFFKSEKENKLISNLTPSDFRNWLFNLSLANERHREFIELMNKVVDFKIASGKNTFGHTEKSNIFHKDFNFRFTRMGELLEVFFRNSHGEIPLSSFGTGIQQMVYIIFKIFDASPKILLIEEIELNLSPKYQDVLIDYFDNLIKKKRAFDQLFVTSHSPLHCYRSQDRSLMAKIDDSGETDFEEFNLTTGDNAKLKAAHDFLIQSIYDLKE